MLAACCLGLGWDSLTLEVWDSCSGKDEPAGGERRGERCFPAGFTERGTSEESRSDQLHPSPSTWRGEVPALFLKVGFYVTLQLVPYTRA